MFLPVLTRCAESGIIVFNIVSGQIRKKARLEVLMDDGYWPAFTTAKSPSTNAHWKHVGEGFVKELDFGRVWLRLNENDEGGKDEIIAEWKGDAKPFLESTLVRAPFSSRSVSYSVYRVALRSTLWKAWMEAHRPLWKLKPDMSPFQSHSRLAKASTVRAYNYTASQSLSFQ